MSPGATFERVYLALKEQLRSGRFHPGDHLEPASIGSDLNSSITPVRDALHRLVGERLVESPRGDGFRMPYLTEIGLRHLYRWNSDLLLLATGRGQSWSNAVRAEAPLETAAELFLDIARLTQSPEHVAAVAAAGDRLALPRAAETQILSNLEEEIRDLAQALAAPDRKRLRLLLAAYHRRRMRVAAQVVAKLQPAP